MSLVTGILYWRRPDSIDNPQFWAEDGSRFFPGALYYGLESLWLPYSGYYHSLARLAAWIGHIAIPKLYMPHFYYFFCWLVLMVAVGYIFSSRFAFSIRLKFLLALALVANTAGNEVFFNLANLTSVLGPLWILLALSREPESRAQAAFDLALLLLVGLSSAYAVCLWPLFFLRCGFRRSSAHSRWLAGLSLIVAFCQVWNMPARALSQGGLFPPLTADFWGSLANVGINWGAFLLLGEKIAGLPTPSTDPAFMGYSLLILLFLYGSLWHHAVKGKNQEQLTVLAGHALAIGLSLYVNRHTLNNVTYVYSGRHFFIPAVTFLWGLLLSNAAPPRLERFLLAMSVGAFLFLTPTAKNQTFPDLDWAGHLARCTGTQRACKIPINPVTDPPVWNTVVDSHVFTVPPLKYPFFTRFEDRIELLGFDVEETPTALNLTLIWRAAGKMQHDYKFFVHLSAADQPDAVLAQYDAMALDWQYPTSFWVKGEVISDSIQLPLENLSPGAYRLAVGWYDPQAPHMDRLPAWDNEGRPWENDRALLPVTLRRTQTGTADQSEKQVTLPF